MEDASASRDIREEIMKERRGEKIGWVVGWIGGFLWLCLLSIVWLIQGKIINSVIGIILFTLGVFLIVALAPWRHPETQYWKLMVPTYAVLISSISLFIWFEGGLEKMGLNWWAILWLMPLLIPFATMGKRSWNEDRRSSETSEKSISDKMG